MLGMKGSTFPAKKALSQARRLGHEGAAALVELLAQADLDLRGAQGVAGRPGGGGAGGPAGRVIAKAGRR